MWEQKADDRALSGGISRLGSKFWKKQQNKPSVLSELERTEGSGTSNGVSYVYRFSSKAWFGSYEVKHQRRRQRNEASCVCAVSRAQSLA